MKETSNIQKLAAHIPNTSPLSSDGRFGYNGLLTVCKRLKEKVSKRVIDEQKGLMEDVDIDNQWYMGFLGVAPIRELRK